MANIYLGLISKVEKLKPLGGEGKLRQVTLDVFVFCGRWLFIPILGSSRWKSETLSSEMSSWPPTYRQTDRQTDKTATIKISAKVL